MRDEEKGNEIRIDKKESHGKDRGAGVIEVKRTRDSETGVKEGGAHRAKKKRGGTGEKRHREGAAEQGNTKRTGIRQIGEEETETAGRQVTKREAVDPEAGRERKRGKWYHQVTKQMKKISDA